MVIPPFPIRNPVTDLRAGLLTRVWRDWLQILVDVVTRHGHDGATTTLQVRSDTAAGWTAANPTLAAGEPGFESDTAKLKIGDGTTAWNAAPYI